MAHPTEPDSPAQQERNDDPQHGDQRGGPTNADQLACFHFQSHSKQEEHYTQFGHRREHLGWLDPRENTGTDENTGQDLADNPRLPDSLEHLSKHLCCPEHEEHGQRDVLTVTGHGK